MYQRKRRRPKSWGQLTTLQQGDVKRRRIMAQERRRNRMARRALNTRTGGFLGIELKFLDAELTGAPILATTDATGGIQSPTGGSTGCLSAPADGNGEENRNGRKYTIKSCFVTGFISSSVLQDAADVLSPPTVFVAIVQDKQSNGATAASQNIFANSTGSSTINAYPHRNLQFSERFKVLNSKTITPGVVTATTDGANTSSVMLPGKPFKLSWKGNMPVNCNGGTTANITSIVDNSIHLVAYATTTNYTPTLNYRSRIRFVG